jgi:hypothetical protein
MADFLAALLVLLGRGGGPGERPRRIFEEADASL